MLIDARKKLRNLCEDLYEKLNVLNVKDLDDRTPVQRAVLRNHKESMLCSLTDRQQIQLLFDEDLTTETFSRLVFGETSESPLGHELRSRRIKSLVFCSPWGCGLVL